MKLHQMENALRILVEKYAVSTMQPFHFRKLEPNLKGSILLPANRFEELDNAIPLFYWRFRRSLVELKKLVFDETIVDPCLLRLSYFGKANGQSLRELIYQKLDICEFITSDKIYSVFAIGDGQQHVNILVKLRSGILCSIEICLNLSITSQIQERHEIIARRGTASDNLIDTQIQQQSIYCFTKNTEEVFTDTDMELFGFTEEEVNMIRSGFDFLKQNASIAELMREHRHIERVVELVYQSMDNHRKEIVN